MIGDGKDLNPKTKVNKSLKRVLPSQFYPALQASVKKFSEGLSAAMIQGGAHDGKTTSPYEEMQTLPRVADG
tara:strand:+ start:1079 stop:1294 length:216 start_codon:yes stop_codon:yes gene_type:complete